MSNKKNTKVVIVGAGSMFFSRKSIVGFIRSKLFDGGELCLVDIDEKKLGIVEKVAYRVRETLGADVTIKATVDRKEVLPRADFVVLTFANRGIYYRGLDCRLANKYGIRMSSGDTTGPGGIFRTLRTVPTVLEVAKDMEELCPDSWVINYSNPTATIGIALNRYTRLKTIALCDSQEMPQFKEKIVRHCGLVREDEKISNELMNSVKMKVGGLNHFCWIVELKQNKKNLFPTLRRFLVTHKEKNEFYRPILQLFDAYGYFPTTLKHVVEYVPFFQGKGADPINSYMVKIWDEEVRWKWWQRFWDEMEGYADGRNEVMHDVINKTPMDLCIRIIEAILTDAKEVHFVNIPNGGTISNLPEDAVLEIAAEIGREGYKPLEFGDFPRGLLGMTQRVLDSHELAVEAAITGSHRTLLKAFLADPIVFSIEDAKSLIKEMLKKEKEALPLVWRS